MQKYLKIGLFGSLIASTVCMILAGIVTFLFWSDITVFILGGVSFMTAALVMGTLFLFFLGPTRSRKMMRSFDFCVLSLIAGGILAGVVGSWLRYPLFTGFLFMFVGLAILVAIAAQLVALPQKTAMGTVLSIMAIVFLLSLLVPIGHGGLKAACAFMYTPAALTDRNLRVYNACVDFAKAHGSLDSFELTEPNRLTVGDDSFFIDSPLSVGGREEFFSPNDIDELKRCWRELRAVGCNKFQKAGEILLFYQEARRILPTAPGVAYSLSSRNPNDINSELLNAVKPLVQVVNNWYMSRNLVLVEGRRGQRQMTIPKSLIDRSLRVTSIEPNEIGRFLY